MSVVSHSATVILFCPIHTRRDNCPTSSVAKIRWHIGKKVLHVHEALGEARHMVQRGMTNVLIQDNAGHSIDGNDLLACVKGEKVLSDDLRAHYVS